MLRKLLLIGVALAAGPGTVLQLAVAIATSFVFFAAHVKTWPFRLPQADNSRGRRKNRSTRPLYISVVVLHATTNRAARTIKNDFTAHGFRTTPCAPPPRSTSSS